MVPVYERRRMFEVSRRRRVVRHGWFATECAARNAAVRAPRCGVRVTLPCARGQHVPPTIAARTLCRAAAANRASLRSPADPARDASRSSRRCRARTTTSRHSNPYDDGRPPSRALYRRVTAALVPAHGQLDRYPSPRRRQPIRQTPCRALRRRPTGCRCRRTGSSWRGRKFAPPHGALPTRGPVQRASP